MASKKTNEAVETKAVSEEPATKADTPLSETGNTTTKQEAAASPASDSGGFCMYIGPSILGVIQSGTVYPGAKEEVKAQLAGVIERYPLVEKLIVSDKTLPEDRIKAKTPGNYLYNLYQKLTSGGGGK